VLISLWCLASIPEKILQITVKTAAADLDLWLLVFI